MTKTGPIHTWKSKPSDLLLTIVYFVLYGVVIHCLTSVKQAIKYDRDIYTELKNPGYLLFSVIIVFFFMSPVWVYFRKVPKQMKLDLNTRKLEIRKRNRTLRYNMDKIRFYKRNMRFFTILEIHATFQLSNNKSVEKMATSVVVPNRGLSWNKKKMEEIAEVFRSNDIEEIANRPAVSVYDYFYN